MCTVNEQHPGPVQAVLFGRFKEDLLMKKISRRSFLAVAGAAAAAAALTACGGSSSSTAASTASSAAASAAGDATAAANDPKVTLVYAEVNLWIPSLARPLPTSRRR